MTALDVAGSSSSQETSEAVARTPDRWPVVRAALAEAGRETLVRWRALARGPRRASSPERLLFAPQDLRIADPVVAQDMADGLFVLGDRTLSLPPGTSPLSVEPPSPAWAAEFYGLGWLRHLRAAETPAARQIARAILTDALGPSRKALDHPVARRPDVTARRVVSLLASSPLVLTGADHVLYRRYLRRIGRDVAALGRAIREAPPPLDRLSAAIGLCVAGLCCAGYEGRLRRATRILAVELDAQILADGGHLARSPAILLDLLLDLLPLRLLYATRSVEIPPALERAVDRMLPMLRFFRHGSGDLALFNGMGQTPFGELSTLLAQDKARAAPAQHAAPSGFDRLEAGGTLLLVDTGPVPPLPVSSRAHAGCLSFEMSSGMHRIVVNCGAPGWPGPARDSARETAAHSTLVLMKASAGRPLRAEDVGRTGWATRFVASRFGPVLLGGPRRVGAERGLSAEHDILLSGHHDGYEAEYGAIHTRSIRLSPDGSELEGEDALSLRAGARDDIRSAVLHFHLHPTVQARVEDESGGILLELPDGERWRFGAEGARPVLEPSVFFAVTEGRRPTRRITLGLDLEPGTRRTTRRWLFVRA